MKTHYTIPFFVPHHGCPFKCIFCNQRKITGRKTISSKQINHTINEYLSTIPKSPHCIEVGFFGGTFTGIKKNIQKNLLSAVQPFVEDNKINGIRLSTRPDFIDSKTLDFLKDNNVTCIELGVQSMSDKVLKNSKRGHTSQDIILASQKILQKGFSLGHQIMVGLPSSTFKDELNTAEWAFKLGASETRIYPVIVIKNTELARLWKNNKYIPLNEEEAVKRCSKIMLYLHAQNIKVIRCGLHPSEGLLNGNDFLAGPFHPSFGQKTETEIFSMMLRHILKFKNILSISFNTRDEAVFFGFKKHNAPLIKKIFNNAIDYPLKRNDNLPSGSLLIEFKDKSVLIDRKYLYEKYRKNLCL